MKAPIAVSDKAQQHIRIQLEQTESQFLRLGLKESGCNGFMYTLDFLTSPDADDECYDVAEGVRICVAQAHLERVVGTEVDIVTEGLNAAMVFKNPNAQSYCGCGESFALGDEAEDLNAGEQEEPTIAKLATNVGGEG
jgi:iron-sulfur cluster assembly accessory protein